MKLRPKNLLVGQTVIVDPDLTTDPFERRGQIGRVIEYDVQFPSVTVLFDDGKNGHYLTDTIYAMQPRKNILQGLINNYSALTDGERKIILNVIKLVEERAIQPAIYASLTNDTIKRHCLCHCADLLDLKLEEKRKRRNVKKI
ncbi:hypothetical protein [Dinghuibacter silviterrae]|uniref:DUF4314 domain-containing protein n=1 Tax=Dinghuibacter silviterrae TaxID=1539049 RepID=A0A4R8DQT3_9BACT|nr:hypothetical protein [Dinghuibacter silviterrae]TDX00520.1 hypothetical protein EDB95_1545 [Dinghuibacter silviterrae]